VTFAVNVEVAYGNCTNVARSADQMMRAGFISSALARHADAGEPLLFTSSDAGVAAFADLAIDICGTTPI
jgi:hypothetical protein